MNTDPTNNQLTAPLDQPARSPDRLQQLERQLAARTAELAVIHSIQQGVASALGFQAIIDLVGDKLREIFNTWDIGIRLFDPTHTQLLAPYFYSRGDQAVIAIQNARLFNATQEALERQTATADILAVMSASPTRCAFSWQKTTW